MCTTIGIEISAPILDKAISQISVKEKCLGKLGGKSAQDPMWSSSIITMDLLSNGV